MKLPDWYRWAACDGADPGLFFADAKGWSSKAGKAICARCPARQACLQHALDEGLDYGIWGGATAGERLEMLGRRVPRTVPR